MSQFDQVSVIREANVYFDGGVTSRTILFADGSRKTLGIVQPGRYSFDTGAREVMEILGGELSVLLPGEDEWRRFVAGERFEVPAGARFEIEASAVADYCCSFLP
jgi:uncharacterized protein YaiE (UPF0345 family)